MSINMEKEQILQNIDKLTSEAGFIYAFVFILVKHIFHSVDELGELNLREELSFQELAYLAGLMVKRNIDMSVPTPEIIEDQMDRTDNLFKKLHESYMAPFLKRMEEKLLKLPDVKKEEEEDYEEFFGSGEMMTEPIFYSGSGAYDFQYLELATKRYEKDTDWIQTNKGINISTAIQIARYLRKMHERKLNNLSFESTQFDDLCRSFLDIFCFSSSELNMYDNEVVQNFLNCFTVQPASANQQFSSPGEYNVIDSHPIIKLEEDLYFLPITFNLCRSVYESPFYWMIQDDPYYNVAAKHRGEATVDIAYQMLVNVFGKHNVHKDVKVKKSKKETITDIDLLAVAGNKAIVIQSKSKTLSELARRGDEQCLRDDFKKAIQDAYKQGLACRGAILSKQNDLVLDSGTSLKLNEAIDDVYIICLLASHYPANTHQTRVYLKRKENEPTPITMSVFDLDIVTFYLTDPFELLYYIRQRINHANHYITSEEMSLLALHLRSKLFPNPNVHKVTIDESMTQLIDVNFPAMRGEVPITDAVEKLHNEWANEKIDQVIQQIKEIHNPGFTDAIFFLYDLSGDCADNLISLMEQTKNKTRVDEKPRDFTMLLDNNEAGISFMCQTAYPESLGKNLFGLAIARKYKSKTDTWLGIGCMIGSAKIIDAVVFSKEPWTYDPELESFSKVALKQGSYINLKNKIRKNDPCPCGSGRKYKKCCGK